MRILHLSDSHGSAFWKRNDLTGIDAVVHTGDLLPNWSRGVRPIETPFQETWCMQNAPEIVAWLNGRPFVAVQGNHDFASICRVLSKLGARAHDLSAGDVVELRGLRFGGFPAVPTINGEWNHERAEPEIGYYLSEVLDRRLDVLLTHAPPMGILDGCAKPFGTDHIGSEATHALLFSGKYPTVRYHLFGHCHEAGGQTKKVGAIRFFNAATARHRIEIPC